MDIDDLQAKYGNQDLIAQVERYRRLKARAADRADRIADRRKDREAAARLAARPNRELFMARDDRWQSSPPGCKDTSFPTLRSYHDKSRVTRTSPTIGVPRRVEVASNQTGRAVLDWSDRN